MKLGPWLILLLLFLFPGMEAMAFQLLSPGKLIKVDIRQDGKSLLYNLSCNGEALIKSSRLGLLSAGANLSEGDIRQAESNTVNQTWSPLFGKNSSIVNHYNESVFHIETVSGILVELRVRIYDDGAAFRYELAAQKGLTDVEIVKDITEFRFAADYIARGVDRNVETSEFQPKPLSKISFSKLPLLVQTPSAWIAINEASVSDFSEAFLANNGGNSTMSVDVGKSVCRLPMKTPWRVIQVGATAGTLIESNILVNLNETCKIEDPSWIKPGKSMWDWRNHGDTINGFVYGINEASYRRLIDFASANSIRYVLFDSGWYSDKGPQYPRDDPDMRQIIRYAGSKNVDVLLYLDRRHGGNRNGWSLDAVLNTFQQWGVKGIKYGFLGGEISDRKTFVDSTRSITRLCAKYHMLVAFHDNPVHPGGEERTWPNLITREYCHGQQDSRRSFGPAKAVTVPFINGLSGALDMSNGFYDLDGLQNRLKVDKNGLNSTVAGENARCFINYTPLLILPDNGDEYSKKSDMFSFIRQMPDSWDETRVISGVPGESIVIARRSGSDWFLGGLTNEQGRTLSIPLSFLCKGTYRATVFKDGKDAHYITNKRSCSVEGVEVDPNKTFQAVLAPGGGFCMIIRKIVAK